jgi:hypothetical protein
MILILSENFDASTNKVIDWINFFGYSVIRINETDYLDFVKLKLTNDSNKDYVSINYNGCHVKLSDIKSFYSNCQKSLE